MIRRPGWRPGIVGRRTGWRGWWWQRWVIGTRPFGIVPVAEYYNPYCDAGEFVDSQPICGTCDPSAVAVAQGGTDGSDDQGDADDQGQGGTDQSQGGTDQGQGGTDQGQGSADQGQGGADNSQGGTDQSKGDDDKSQDGADQGKGDDDNGQSGSDQGKGDDDKSQGGADQGKGDDDKGQGGADKDGSPADDGNTQPVSADAEDTAYNRALAAFKKGNHKAALTQINAAAKQFPNSGDVHQLRSLIHFGMKNYKAAAAAAHKALSGDSPWEWNDLKSVYASTKTYTSDLRALEGFAAKNASSKPAQFLLAYHYLMMDHKDAARTALKKVVALEPRDRLAAGLLQAMDKAQN